jgi:hypothetical protein
VPKLVMEPMLLRLAACGAKRWSSEPSWLRFCLNIINLLSKSMLTFSLRFFIAGRIFQKTMFPRHLRTNATDMSCVFRVIESCIKLVILPIGLKETQSLFFSNM